MPLAEAAPAETRRTTSHRLLWPRPPGPMSDTRIPTGLVDRVAALFAEARRAQAVARFAAGDAVHALRYDRTTPEAVEQLANHLCVERSGLLRIARTSERIRDSERLALLALVDKRGLPLTWSHFELLAVVASREARIELARAAATDGLSVRDLQRLVASQTASRSFSSRRSGAARSKDGGTRCAGGFGSEMSRRS